jgi:hypothetical protein
VFRRSAKAAARDRKRALAFGVPYLLKPGPRHVGCGEKLARLR